MVMKNVKTAHFWQDNHQIKRIRAEGGSFVYPLAEAWKKFPEVKKYFSQLPKEGYFLWIRKNPISSFFTRISISEEKVLQNLSNLILLEPGVRAEIDSACWSEKKKLGGGHQAVSKVVLKKGAQLIMRENQSWGGEDKVETRLDFWLEEKANLVYFFKCLQTPKVLKTESNFYLQKEAKSNLVFTLLANQGNLQMKDSTFLNGKGASGILRSRIVGGQKAQVRNRSRMIANQAGTGHVDCSGLLLSDQAMIQVIPELKNRRKNASLTHEASVGRIAEEVLDYLRTRGLTEEEATDLVIASFLGEKESIRLEEKVFSSHLSM
jgi:uncharacterized protein